MHLKNSPPAYIRNSMPVKQNARSPWYKSTFPTYAGAFLWVGFYLKLSGPTLSNAGISVSLLGIFVSGILCFGLYYYVPGMLGMQTGQPLYVVSTSTFGTTAGYIIPGLMMGILQIGWVAVITTVAANFIMAGLHSSSHLLHGTVIVAWLICTGWVAVKGIQHIGQVAKIANWFPFVMIIVVFWWNKSGITFYRPLQHHPLAGFLNALSITIGFFATAGAAGADFGMSNRNQKDIALGGLSGIVGGCTVAGGLSMLSVAGYLGRTAGANNYDYSAAIASVGPLAPLMFFLFAAASIVPTCFSSFVAANSFSTMLPRLHRGNSTLFAVSVSGILAITNVADNLLGFFGIVAASFGPICGAMMADYLQEGCQWSGPRSGINWAGCVAWAIGFVFGIPERIPGLPASWIKADNPAELYSFVIGFIVYLILSWLGLRPHVISTPQLENIDRTQSAV
jgi:cytosine permease